MATDREDFLATTEHRRPSRILYHAGFTDDLQRRVIEHVGTKDIGAHYGFYRSASLWLRRPDTMPRPAYSKYWENEKIPERTVIDGRGVAHVPAHFYHFTKYISPLRNAKSLKDIEDYPFDDPSLYDAAHLPDLDADGMLHFERPIDTVENVAAHVADGAIAEIVPAMPGMRMQIRVVVAVGRRANPLLPVQPCGHGFDGRSRPHAAVGPVGPTPVGPVGPYIPGFANSTHPANDPSLM